LQERRRPRIKVVSPEKIEEGLVVPSASKPSPPVQTKHPKKKKERKKGKLQKK